MQIRSRSTIIDENAEIITPEILLSSEQKDIDNNSIFDDVLVERFGGSLQSEFEERGIKNDPDYVDESSFNS